MKKAVTALAALLLAAAVGLSVYFACRSAEKKRTETAFYKTVAALATDAGQIAAGKDQYITFAASDVNSLITLCGVDEKDALTDGLARELLTAYAYLTTRPEACRDNIRLVVSASESYLQNKDANAFTQALREFAEAAENHTVTE